MKNIEYCIALERENKHLFPLNCISFVNNRPIKNRRCSWITLENYLLKQVWYEIYISQFYKTREAYPKKHGFNFLVDVTNYPTKKYRNVHVFWNDFEMALIDIWKI
jgi:hypothetical protein